MAEQNPPSGNKIWLNDGSGNFIDSGHSITDIGPGMLIVGDLDGDGDLDFFVSEQNPPRGNKIWLNDGHGVFTDSGQSLGDSATLCLIGFNLSLMIRMNLGKPGAE